MTTTEQLQAEIEKLRAQNPALVASQPKPSDRISLGDKLTGKVSEKGAYSVYGIHSRFPITLYASQWRRLLSVAQAIVAQLDAQNSKLKQERED
jgi:cell division protein FtsB